jgi:hypothetical protein
VDPLVDLTGQPYAYTGDDPVNAVDPLGLFCLLGTNPGGGCRGASEAKAVGRAVTSGVKKYDPFYSALEDYDKEYHARQDGCSLSTVFGFAAEAVVADVETGASVDGEGEVADAVDAAEDAGAQTLRHYTTQSAADAISKTGSIEPSLPTGLTWVTPDLYATAGEAQSGLALSDTPEGYFEFPASRVVDPSPMSTVASANGFPGGGSEITTANPIDIEGIPFTAFP